MRRCGKEYIEIAVTSFKMYFLLCGLWMLKVSEFARSSQDEASLEHEKGSYDCSVRLVRAPLS